MSKLKITEVQVDCRELTKEQIDRMCEIVKTYGYIVRDVRPSAKCNYFKQAAYLKNIFTIGIYNPNNTTLFYDEFINIFDKPKFKPKKAIKELEQRIALLEQKLSEKEVVIEADVKFGVGDKLKELETNNVFKVTRITKDKVYVKTISDETITFPIPTITYSLRNKYWIPLPPTNEVEKEAENSVNEAVNELPIVIEKGMRFRHHITGGIYEIEGVSDEKVYVYTSDKQNAIEYEFNNVMDYFNKGHWITLPPTEKKESELLKQAKERYKQDDVVNCLAFKNYGTLDFSKEGYVSESQIWVYSPTLDTNICVYKDGVWAGLKKEEVLTKGAICKFWNDDEDNYEIGRYEANLDEDEDTYIHVNILTLDSFKNAKVISIDEALQLFKKQLLNEK